MFQYFMTASGRRDETWINDVKTCCILKKRYWSLTTINKYCDFFIPNTLYLYDCNLALENPYKAISKPFMKMHISSINDFWHPWTCNNSSCTSYRGKQGWQWVNERMPLWWSNPKHGTIVMIQHWHNIIYHMVYLADRLQLMALFPFWQ